MPLYVVWLFGVTACQANLRGDHLINEQEIHGMSVARMVRSEAVSSRNRNGLMRLSPRAWITDGSVSDIATNF